MKIFEKIFALIAILILNFSIVYAEEEVPPEAQEIFDKINELSKTREDVRKNFDFLNENAHMLIKKFPDDKIVLRRAYNTIGKIYTFTERYDIARTYLNKSYQINPGHPSVYFFFGLLEDELKNYDQSTKYYEKSLELETNNEYKSDCENNIGANYKEQKNFTEAIKHYTASINYFPLALTYKNRGRIFADEMKDYSTAIMDFNKAIELDGKYLDAYWRRASAYYNLKNYSAALKDYKKVLELDSEQKKIYYSLGACYQNMKIYSTAIDYYTKYLYFYPNDKWAYNYRGFCCGQIGDYGTAAANFTSAIMIDQNFALAYHNRGVTYKKLGSTEQANQDFARARQLGYNG